MASSAGQAEGPESESKSSNLEAGAAASSDSLVPPASNSAAPLDPLSAAKAAVAKEAEALEEHMNAIAKQEQELAMEQQRREAERAEAQARMQAEMQAAMQAGGSTAGLAALAKAWASGGAA